VSSSRHRLAEQMFFDHDIVESAASHPLLLSGALRAAIQCWFRPGDTSDLITPVALCPLGMRTPLSVADQRGNTPGCHVILGLGLFHRYRHAITTKHSAAGAVHPAEACSRCQGHATVSRSSFAIPVYRLRRKSSTCIEHCPGNYVIHIAN